MATNKLFTVGRLTADPELRTVKDVPCTNFTVAADTKSKDENGEYVTNFYHVTAWRA